MPQPLENGCGIFLQGGFDMSWELDFEREETIEDILRQAGLCESFQKGEEAVLKLKKA